MARPFPPARQPPSPRWGQPAKPFLPSPPARLPPFPASAGRRSRPRRRPQVASLPHAARSHLHPWPPVGQGPPPPLSPFQLSGRRLALARRRPGPLHTSLPPLRLSSTRAKPLLLLPSPSLSLSLSSIATAPLFLAPPLFPTAVSSSYSPPPMAYCPTPLAHPTLPLILPWRPH